MRVYLWAFTDCIGVVGYLSEQVLHLGLFGPEALDLLVDSGIFLKLLQSGPLAVKVGTGPTHTAQLCQCERFQRSLRGLHRDTKRG